MEGKIEGAEGMSEPKFLKGETVVWARGPGAPNVTIVDGPFRGVETRDRVAGWHPWSYTSEFIYLCKPEGGKAKLLGEAVLSNGWQPCPGEHRLSRSLDAPDMWERRE